MRGDPPWLNIFEVWLREALDARIPEPNAMVLGTADARGRVSTRCVLCKGADANGVVFFTGYNSGKGLQLADNPYASVTFPWIALKRQVHFRGPVEHVSREETQAYWELAGARGWRISARASTSRVRSPAASTSRRRPPTRPRVSAGFRRPGEEIPCPPDWGGYRILPEEVEFWQGRANRLHNRVRLTHVDHEWRIERLQP